MKPTFINIRVLGTTALALLFATSCSDILNEQPRSIYEPTFFQTEKGVEGGINHDILVAKNRKFCICTAMLYDPKLHEEDKI